MENLSKENFESQWRNAFVEAEYLPSEGVWTNIELSLQKSATGQMKKRLLFFQLLAAASIAFAMTIGGVGIYNLINESTNDINSKGTISLSTDENEATQLLQEIIANEDIATEDFLAVENSTIETKAVIEKSTVISRGLYQQIAISVLPELDEARRSESKEISDFIPTVKYVNLVNSSFSVKFLIPDKIDPVTDYALLLLADYSPDNLEKSQASSEKFWTGLSMAAGTFGTGMGTSAQDFANSPDSNNQASFTSPSSNSGSTLRMGMMLGGKISNKWVLQGGLTYMQQFTEYMSNVAGMDGAVRTNFTPLSNASLTSPYQLNSNQQFISVPLQAGYLLVDRKFGFQLNAGMATDFFIQNNLSDPSGVFANYAERGASSAYRNVNLASLAGTELSYRFGENYRLSLAPGMRYAMHSILKSETNSSFQPFTFDFAVRFNYLIK
jgi:hypothetical protein